MIPAGVWVPRSCSHSLQCPPESLTAVEEWSTAATRTACSEKPTASWRWYSIYVALILLVYSVGKKLLNLYVSVTYIHISAFVQENEVWILFFNKDEYITPCIVLSIQTKKDDINIYVFANIFLSFRSLWRIVSASLYSSSCDVKKIIHLLIMFFF